MPSSIMDMLNFATLGTPGSPHISSISLRLYLQTLSSTLIDWLFSTCACPQVNVCDFIVAQSLRVNIAMVQTELNIVGLAMT